MSKIGLGPGAPRRGPFSSPNRFQIINNSVVSPPLFQNIIREKSEKMRCERNGVERAYTRKIWKMPLPFRNFSSASPYSIFYRFGRNEKTALPHNTDLHVASLCCWGKAVFLFCEKAHSFSIFRRKSAFSFDFSENRKLSVPYGAKIFSFLAVQTLAPERGAIMRKQVQKERCTKIKLEKCKNRSKSSSRNNQISR